MIFLKHILTNLIRENEESDISASTTNSDITNRTLKDEFDLANTGLEYVKIQLEKLNKKARRIGAPPLIMKVLSEFDKNVTIHGVITKAHFFKVKVEGESPIIDGYEFIASIEHAEEGNIVNMCPSSSVKSLPSEYLTTKNTCDFCHTKRDRLNTFILRKTDGGQLMKVGRSCLKNFLPGKNPAGILAYGEMLSNALRELVAGESMEDYGDEGGGGRLDRQKPESGQTAPQMGLGFRGRSAWAAGAPRGRCRTRTARPATSPSRAPQAGRCSPSPRTPPTAPGCRTSCPRRWPSAGRRR